MQKLTQNEVKLIATKQGAFRSNPRRQALYQELANLAVEEGILIKKDDWPLKSPPAVNSGQFSKQKYNILPQAKFSLRTLTDDSGWVIIRNQ